MTPLNVERKCNSTALDHAADPQGLCSGGGGRAALKTAPPSLGALWGQVLTTAAAISFFSFFF